MKLSKQKRHYTITEATKELGVTRAAVHRAITGTEIGKTPYVKTNFPPSGGV